MKKQNIAILVPRISGSGPARVVSNLSIHLPDEYYNKTVIVYYEEESSFEVNGTVISLETGASKNPLRRITNTIKRIRTLKKIKRKYNIHSTISLLPNPNLVNILSRANDKVIISERSFMSKELTGLYGEIYKLIYKFFYRKADLVIAVSEVVKLDLIKNFGVKSEKIKVIYNFYDIKEITSLSTETIPEEYSDLFNYPTIITAGRLSNQKGQWHLIRAFKNVKKEIPEAKLIILGEGDLEGYLMQLTKSLGLEKDVHFLGFHKNPFKYISKADIYAFPSLYEGFPNALSEAMACGLPIISSDCESGPREILNPSLDIEAPLIKKPIYAEFGVLVPTCDGKRYDSEERLSIEEKYMAESITELLKDRALLEKYKKQSKERISEFNVEHIIGKWIKVIKSN